MTSPFVPRVSCRRLLCAVVLHLLAWAAAAPASAQFARVELHAFATTTLSDQDFLRGRKEGKPATIAGELRLPRSGGDRLPAVVLLHGSGGINSGITDWAEQLNAIGIATFIVDSFSGRGIVNILGDQSQLGRLTMIIDAYRALDLLSGNPRIDPSRIALMGFSRGGQPTLYATMRRFQRTYGSPGRDFAAYIVFYSSCATTYLDDEDTVDRPVRLFHGSADDFSPVAPCRAYVARLRAAGKDVQLTEYPGAHHVFDWDALKKPLRLDKAQRTARCTLIEAQDGVILNAETGQPFSYADRCVEFGPTIAYDEQAAEDSRKAVKRLLREVFNL